MREIDLFSKYAWIVPLKDKRGIIIVNVFRKIIPKGHKPNKTRFDQGGEFYNKLFKGFLKNNNIEMYSTYNEGIYFDVLDDIVNKYNNTVHRTIKMKPFDVTFDSYAEYNGDSNEKDSKLKFDDHVKISKYKNIFAKGYTQNWSEEVFIINKIKNKVPWTYVTSDLNDTPIAGSFYEKELQKASQKECRIEKVIKRKGDKLYVKWKEYHNSFNNWIDKKDTV